MQGRRIILGMGSGRCGTRSLAMLLNRQPGANISHEEHPLLTWRSPRAEKLVKRLERMLRNRQEAVIGDVASFYLPYVEQAIAFDPEIRMVCLKRPREEVVHSFCQWMDKVHPLPTNHWSKRPAPGWHHDPIWTPMFPQYETTDRKEGIGRYWDEYYEQAESLAGQFPNNVRTFDWLHALNTTEGQGEVLSFCGFATKDQVVTLDIHENKGETAPLRKAEGLDSADANDPRRCVVLVPFSGQIAAPCERALEQLEKRGYPIRRVEQYAAIDQVRNQMATDALVEGFVETLWINANVVIDAADVERIRSRGLPITCRTYSSEPVETRSAAEKTDTPSLDREQPQQPSPRKIALVHVRREVYERIQWELELPVCGGVMGKQQLPFFQPLIHEADAGPLYLSDEWAFFERARQCGFAVSVERAVQRAAALQSATTSTPSVALAASGFTPCPRERCAILVPVGDHIEPACDTSLRELEARGYRVSRAYGYKQIDLGRSQMASDALAAGCEETLWIDADTAFHPDMVERLRGRDVPIVCGIYPKKSKRELAIHALPGTEHIHFGVGGGLLEIMYAPTGFLLVRREVYVRIRTQLELPSCRADTGRTLVPYYAPLIRPDGEGWWYLAEDFAFCERARQCGYKIMADSSVRLLHIGTYDYGWEDAGREISRYAKFKFRLTDGKKRGE